MKTIEDLRTSNSLKAAKYAKDYQDFQEALKFIDVKADVYKNEVDKNNGSCTTESCKKLFADFQAKLKEGDELTIKIEKNASSVSGGTCAALSICAEP